MNAKLLLSLGAAVALLPACNNVCDIEQPATIVPGSPEDFQANVPGTVYFDFDKADLTEAAMERVKAQACWLNTYTSTKAVVEGHADARGTREYNMALGLSRANATKKALESNGVASDRITVVSYGKDRPVDLGQTEEAYAKNRRTLTRINPANDAAAQ